MVGIKRLGQIIPRVTTRARSLQVLLVTSFGVQVFAAVTITGWLSFRHGQQAVNDLASDLSREATNRIEDQIQHDLKIRDQWLDITAATIASGSLSVTDPAQLRQYFWQQLTIAPLISSFYYGSSEGDFIGVQRRDPQEYLLWQRTAATAPQRETYALDAQGNPTALIDTIEYDPRQRPWYEAAQAAQAPTWSPIYRFASRDYARLGITPATPIYAETGELQGVLALDMTLEQMSEFLRQMTISPRGKAFVLERSGAIVASSVNEPPFTTVADQETRLQAIRSTDATIQAATQFLVTHFQALDQIQSRQQLSFEIAGDRQWVEVLPLQLDPALNWLVVVVIPEADFMAQIQDNARTTILLCGVALLGAIAIGIGTARWITGPILGLNQAAKRLAIGQWDYPLPHPRRQDEIAELAASFEKMATQLKSSFQTLEAKNSELQALDRLKDEFLANTSHELRTPLNGIIGIAESLVDGATGQLSDQTRANLSMIAASGRRLSTLINDILDFAKLQHRGLQLHQTAVGLREAVEVVLILSKPLVRTKSIQLLNEVPADLSPAWADEDRLQQILHNLIGNAIKFTEAGSITVTARLQPLPVGSPAIATAIGDAHTDPTQELQISVTDTGIGIPDPIQERIFAAFEQGDGSAARAYGGTGLGLAVTKQLVELHGGTIWVSSTVGQGSTFTFTLPVSVQTVPTNHHFPLHQRPDAAFAQDNLAISRLILDPHSLVGGDQSGTSEPSQPTLPAPVESPLTALPPQSSLTILIVDDEPVNLQVLVNYLSLEQYQIAKASSGPEALELLEQGLQPDLILLDVMMPGMTGYEVCQQIRQTYPAHELPILMLTAKNQVSALVEGLESGANDYLAKPVSRDELLARIRVHLDLSKINLAYGRFVPQEFLKFLNRDSIVDVQLGDQVQREMSVLFADIRNFTTLSESMSPEENFRFINSCFSRLEPAITKHHGFIDKYIGDGIMALFSGTADDAVLAGIDLLDRLNDYNAHRKNMGYEVVRVGIGINTGELMLGTVGGVNRMDGTVVSDAVNLAARIENLTKEYGVSLLISDDTLQKLANPDQYSIRRVDRVKVRGRSELITVYEVFDADPEPIREQKWATKHTFEQALFLFEMRQWEVAGALLSSCIAQYPDDLVAQVYYRRCAEHQQAKSS